MRALVIAALVALPAVVSADPLAVTSWDEIGIVHARIDMTNGDLVDGYAVRFAPRVPISSNVYIGAELDTGTLSGRVATSPAFRVSGSGGEMASGTPVTGKFGAVRAVVGVRARFGILSAAGEFAVGAHAADLRDDLGQEVAGRTNETILEGRARLDLWVSPRLTVGGIAGVGLDDSRDLTAGIMLGYHWGNYDGMR